MIDQYHDESLTIPRPRVLILGASTRAVAASALRAGFDPVCVDQFADADLRTLAQVFPVDSLSSAESSGSSLLSSAIQAAGPLPVIYAGGMENQLPLLRQLESTHPVWGARAEAIERVRQPQQLADGLESVKQRVLPVTVAGHLPPRDGTWIIKPIASGGGRGISVWDDSFFGSTPDDQHYFQQRVHGKVYSALFLAVQEPGDVRFVGLTRQLTGCSELHARPFSWCGNIGPVFLPVEAEFLVRRWGNILKWKFGLTGLYGVDFIVDEAGQPWLLEVNPRLTAAVEILELACGLNLLTDHIACYDRNAASAARTQGAQPLPPPEDRLGRAILYAPGPMISRIPLPESMDWETAPQVADIPEFGARIEAGHPLCSVYAWGTDEEDVTAQLFEAARKVENLCDPVE